MNDGRRLRHGLALADMVLHANGSGIAIRRIVGTAINLAGAAVLLADAVTRWPV